MHLRYVTFCAASILFAPCVAEEPEAPSAPKIVKTEPVERQGQTMEDYEQLEKDALRGDYQAQRNLSYWLSGGLGIPPINPVLGCAWRIVILESGSPSVDTSDVGNKEFYCDKKLSVEGVAAAKAQAKELATKISRE